MALFIPIREKRLGFGEDGDEREGKAALTTMKSPKGEAALGNSDWPAQALCWLARALSRACV